MGIFVCIVVFIVAPLWLATGAIFTALGMPAFYRHTLLPIAAPASRTYIPHSLLYSYSILTLPLRMYTYGTGMPAGIVALVCRFMSLRFVTLPAIAIISSLTAFLAAQV